MIKKVSLFVLIFMMISCQQKHENHDVEIHTVNDNMQVGQKLNVPVDNEQDPICGMSTKEFLKDTLRVGDKVLGFCHTGCKEEFVKQNSAQ